MKKQTPFSPSALAGVVFFLLATVFLLSGCERAETGSITGNEGPGEYIIKGPLMASYEIQISDEGERQNDTGKYSEIKVRHHTVLLISEDGQGGLMIPTAKLNKLTWRKQ